MLITTVQPSAGLLASVVMATWLEQTAAGPVAFLLIAHPPIRRQNETVERIEQELRGLAEALGLGESLDKMRNAGSRVWLRGQSGAALKLDGTHLSVQLPPVGPGWSRFVAEGGPVCIVVGLDPLAAGAPREVIEWYLADVIPHGRSLIGSAAVAPECLG
ncbi:hypothetical protein [Streptomyces evansiae]|uniref:hypothetical protein n=1 Tax=Streptomyces evansiae TaxID=3075535 RepID=UPI002884A034|nr:hypothetical protein [Streptomyces sp. DSM 41859]MDT0423503.1 hypothetical protein [Streptomyces sp. DSM 41859]